MDSSKPWHEDEYYWQTWGPVMFSEARKASAPKDIDHILALVSPLPKARILDLCCGVGRHSLELARRGFPVTGVDRTQVYLAQAAEQAKQEGLDIEFIREDMRKFVRPDSFDAVINLYTSFGYFEDPEEDRKVVENIHASLKPGGVLVLEMAGKEVLAHIFQERNWEEADGVFWLMERKVTNDWSWMENRWVLFKDNQRYEGNVNHRLYSASEFKRLLRECGFSEVRTYGALDGRPYALNAQRLVAVAKKSMTNY